jgi:hypothetical protein
MTLEQYLSNINAAYKRGTATEHTYRGDLAKLIETIVPPLRKVSDFEDAFVSL